MDLADVLVAQPGAVMDGHLLLAVAAGPVAGRRVWRDNGVESAWGEIGDVANLSRRRLGESVDDVEVLLAKQEKAVHRFQSLDAGATEQMAHFFILFQQTNQILPILRLLLLLGSRRRPVVRPDRHQQFHIFVDVGHRRFLFVGSQQLGQVQLSNGQCVLFSALDRWRHQRSYQCLLDWGRGQEAASPIVGDK